MNSQPSSASTRSMTFDGGGAGHHHSHGARPGSASPRSRAGRRGVERHRDDGGRAREERDALSLDAAQDVFAVDLADDDLARAHRR